MEDVYEYKLGVRGSAPWLSAIAISLLLGLALQDQTPKVLGAIWGLVTFMIIWFLSRHQVAGVRVDRRHLTLAAWRDPIHIPLVEIDHIRMTDWTDDSDLIVVRTTGHQDYVPSGDLPSIQLFSEVMAERGISIKDPV